MTMSMSLRMGTIVCQYSTPLECLSPQLACGATGKEKLSYPHGITIDQDGFLYVCDDSNNRIQVFWIYPHLVQITMTTNSLVVLLINLMNTWSPWQQLVLLVILINNEHIHHCVLQWLFVLLCTYHINYWVCFTCSLVGNYFINAS